VEVIGTKVVECGSADNDSESGDGSGGDNDGAAENDADGGSGGGCFIAASSFVFREAVLP